MQTGVCDKVFKYANYLRWRCKLFKRISTYPTAKGRLYPFLARIRRFIGRLSRLRALANLSRNFPALLHVIGHVRGRLDCAIGVQ